jgi:hypothetical protein
MSRDDTGESSRFDSLTRRRALAGGAGVLGALAVGGYTMLGDDEPNRPSTSKLGGDEATDTTETGTTETESDTSAEKLAARFAPDLYFGAGEKWFPTDPMQYATERDGKTVVDGFDAFDGYSEDGDGETIPAATVFYNALQYDGTDLGVIQYWFYSAFDQFSVNFHWHDWEVLQVFLDLSGETVEPTLFVASAHSRSVPNNEYLDPGTDRASVISEVGSHSSALGVNETKDRFERLALDLSSADVTNDFLARLDVPLAYGLPRDEGYSLPYVLPDLDGAPIYEHPKLPNVGREDLLPGSLTIRELTTLDSPPTDLPTRETGTDLFFEGRADAETEADETYTLEPISAVREIDEQTGPQLSFEFSVPEFAEDAISKHISAVGVPWEQPRFTDPIVDVTDDNHVDVLRERFDLSDGSGSDGGTFDSSSAIVASVAEAVASEEAPGSNGIDTSDPSTEGVVLLESDPEAVPTFLGNVAVLDPEAGDHRLTVNAPGVAPYAERLTHDPDPTAGTATDPGTDAGGDGGGATDSETAAATATDSATASETATATDTESGSPDPPGLTVAGADGAVVVSPREDAVKLRADASDDAAPSLSRVTVEDDFGGRVFDSNPSPDGRSAVYVNREGAYTAAVEDDDGEIGAYRVNPASEQSSATVSEVRTGKTSLASYLETFLRETRAQAAVFRDGTAEGIDEAVPDDARNPANGQRGVSGDDGTATVTDSTTTATATDSTATATETDSTTTETDSTTTETDSTTTETDSTTTETDSTTTATATDSTATATDSTATATATATPTPTGDGNGNGGGGDGNGGGGGGGGLDPLDRVLRRLDAAIRRHRTRSRHSKRTTRRPQTTRSARSGSNSTPSIGRWTPVSMASRTNSSRCSSAGSSC